MATLIPSISTCASRMTSGERRVAQRLEDKLDDDYLLWYDVPMGPKNAHPDFCVIHPRRGILVLEIKDWKLSTIRQADKQTWEIIPDGIPKSVINPLASPPIRAPGRQRARARPTTGADGRPACGQAGIPLELWRGVYQHHPQAIYRCRAAPRY